MIKFKTISFHLLTWWLILFAMLPVLVIFSLSFFSQSEEGIFKLPLTLENFAILKEAYFYKILFRSFMTALSATACCFVIAYPFSYLLAKQKQANILLVLILIPFWTSSLIRTYALMGLLKAQGLFNLLLLKLHIIHQPLSLLYNQTAVVIGLSYNLLPFMILPLYNTFDKFDHTLISAGRDLNASWLYIFRRVIWPISLPGVKNSLIMVLFPAMTLFYIPNILGGAKSFLLGNLIENQFFVLDDWPGGASTSLLLCLIMVLGLYVTRSQRDD